MGRYIGLYINKGKGGGGGLGPVEPFDRATGISTDGNNNVTSVTLDSISYSNLVYNADGLVTKYDESFDGNTKGWAVSYDSNNLVTSITETDPTTYSISISNMSEGSSQTCTLNTTGVADSTSFYWEIDTSSTNSSDWSADSGTFTVSSGSGTFTITSIADYTAEGSETFSIKIRRGTTSSDALVATSNTATLADTSNTNVIGQDIFTSTQLWTCPANVTLVSVVCIGGGGGAAGNTGPGGGGGGGGALAWMNNIAVTPGNTYTASVGGGGGGVNGNSQAGHGGNSQFGGDSQTVSAQGGRGANGNSGGNGGVVLTGSGGSGGDGGDANGGGGGGGGGGAGGYSGAGGGGGNSSGGNNGASGTGGGGGGGRAENGSNSYNGGGTHPYGEGSSASGSGGDGYVGSYISGSPWGNNNQNQAPGGGGGGRVWSGGQGGASGCVRIIYGQGRAFPSTNTQDQ